MPLHLLARERFVVRAIHSMAAVLCWRPLRCTAGKTLATCLPAH